MDCLFCKIAAGEIPSKKVYEDEWVLAFCDIDPQAPVHLVVIPKEHLPSASALEGEKSQVAARVFAAIAQIVKGPEFAGGYRVVTNCGQDGGQSVEHLHFHLLAGRNLGWPPG